MKYDDASWHSGGEGFPEDVPEEYGGVHIALFLKYCFIKGWAGDVHTSSQSKKVKQVIDGQLSATEFLFSECDGKLTDEDFNDEGNMFAQHAYDKAPAPYFDILSDFIEPLYGVSEDKVDFKKLSKALDKLYQSSPGYVPGNKDFLEKFFSLFKT